MWGRVVQVNCYFFAMSITFSSAGVLMILQSVPDTVFGFGVFQFLVGAFLIGTNPAINAAFVKYTPENFRGRVFGLASTAQQFGNMAGPMLSAAFTMVFPIYTVFILAGLVQLTVGMYILRSHVLAGER